MTRSVTVTGRGAASAVPDSAVVRVAAVTRGRSVQDAFSGTASAVEALLASARSVVAEAGVASGGINLWTHHDEQGRPRGYECRHSVTVRCPSLDDASALLGALVEAVGDRLQVEGVSLEVADPSTAQATARAAAYADAVARASSLAALAEAELGEVLSMTEGATEVGTMDVAAVKRAESMPVAAGEQSVEMSVTVTFALV